MNKPASSLPGGVLVLAAALIILGAFSFAITEDLTAAATAPDFWQTPGLDVAWLVSPTPTPTITDTPTPCPMPEGWVAYQIQPGDSADRLSNSYGYSPELLQLANCQSGIPFYEGQLVFLPAHTVTPTRTFTPTPSETPIRCVYPRGWSPYSIQPGDTAFSLSLKYNIGVLEFQKANCLKENEDLKAGMQIYLPLPATETPIPPPPTPTHTPLPPSATPTITPLILFTVQPT
jgi:LysM repeat protein